MLGEILSGLAPSAVYRHIFTANLTMNNIRLAEMPTDEFIELDILKMEFVWHWRRPGKTQGLSDVNLDVQLLSLFRDSEYVVATQKN